MDRDNVGPVIWQMRIPLFLKKLNWDGRGRDRMTEERLHLLATLLALYPIHDTRKLAQEFCLHEAYVKYLAQIHHVHKAGIARRCINISNGRDVFLRLLWYNRTKEKQIIKTE